MGGLGHMGGPMARRLTGREFVQVVRVHDRRHASERRDRCRKDWIEHGATLVHSFGELVGTGDIDGVFVCCGKNGDDLEIITTLTDLLKRYNSPPKFICHMSTVSRSFARCAEKHCRNAGVQYMNCPLTGGPLGVETGKVLILASGDETLYKHLKPILDCIGKSEYFGPSTIAAAEVKLIGHLMVFNGLFGMCSAVAAHAECFNGGKVGGKVQTDFFDFLNSGAGGSRVWELLVRGSVSDDTWDSPFSLEFGAVDALYTAQMCVERKLSDVAALAVVKVAFAFSHMLNTHQDELSVQSIIRILGAHRDPKFDRFVQLNMNRCFDISECLSRCAQSLPDNVRDRVRLDISEADFGPLA